MYAQHHRHAIWNIQQHPYRHSGSEFTYVNDALPGVTNIEDALNYIVAVLYPNAESAVATPGDLPLVGNTLNDFRVVLDDGDGRQAAYRWEQREGDASPQWYKVLDMDWSSDSILAQLLDITQPLYVSKNGRTDIDENGDPITGLYAGQIIYGGDQANQNLTLNANSGDGVGAQSGYVQIDSQFRPTVNDTYDTGTNTERWRTGYFATSVVSGTLTMASGSITDTSGAISFGDENLSTTGNIDGAIITGTNLVADDTVDQLTIVPGSITDTTGAIDFGDENLSTTGTLDAGLTTLSELGAGTPSILYQFDPVSPTNTALLQDSIDSCGTSFVATASGNAEEVVFDLYVVSPGAGLSGAIEARIYTDNGSNEQDTLLGISTNTINLVSLSTDGNNPTSASFNFAPVAITNTVKYHAAIYKDGAFFDGGALGFKQQGSDPVPNVNPYFISGGSYTQITGGDIVVSVFTAAAGVPQDLVLDPDFSGVSRITSTTGTISFDDEDLITTGTLTAGSLVAGDLAIDNLLLDNNRVSITNTNGNLELQANGTGVVDVLSPMATLGQTVTGTVDIAGQLDADNIRIDGNTLSSLDVNGNIILSPNGTGRVITTGILAPNADNTLDIGTSSLKFRTGYFATSLNNGTNDFLMSELMGLRSANYRDAARTLAVQPGDALFWNGSQWLASAPDTEIDHGTVSGLLDDDHTQYMLLAGRVGGQDLIGGTAANNNLTLESTSDATKGQVLTKDNFAPFTNASFAVTWQGTDLGGSSNYFRDLYTKGELRGARMENFTSGTLPASSAQNVGRFVWATDTNKAYIDNGSSFQVLGVSKFIQDTVWNGTDTTKDVTVSATITDARNAIWALHDNANDFERIYTNIKAISATTVRITVSPALPAGSYRLIGIE